jgi:gas vesicle protein
MTTMSNDPDQLRTEIERTRGNLSRDVNQLGDAVSPGSIAHRQKTKMRRQVSSWKDRVMGTAGDLRDSTMGTAQNLQSTGSGAMDQVSESTHDVAHTAKTQTQGNPLAAGLIAFGAGALLGSLLPASSKEQEAAEALKEKAQPMLQEAADEAKQVGQEMADHLKGPAQDSVQEVKSQAQASAQEVKSQAQSSAQDVKGTAQDAAQRNQP